MTGLTTGQTASTSTRIHRSIKEACMSFSGSSERMRVKQFSLWNNQIAGLIDGDKSPLRFPFVGVAYENTYNQLSVGRQQIDGVFILYIALQSLKFEDEEVLAFKDELYAHLAFTLPQLEFGNFYRSYEVQDTDHANVLVFQQEYQYSYTADDAGDEKKYRIVYPYDIGYNVHY